MLCDMQSSIRMLIATLTQSVTLPVCLPARLSTRLPSPVPPNTQSLVRTFPGMSDCPLPEGIKGLAGVVVDSVNRWGAARVCLCLCRAVNRMRPAACRYVFLCWPGNHMRSAACVCLFVAMLVYGL